MGFAILPNTVIVGIYKNKSRTTGPLKLELLVYKVPVVIIVLHGERDCGRRCR
jgi:hypothetical protein